LLVGDLDFGTALRQHGLPITRFVEGILISRFGYLVPRIGRVEFRLGQQTFLAELKGTVQPRSRIVHLGARLPDHRRLLNLHALIGRVRGQTQSHPRLLQRGVGLTNSKGKICSVEPGDRVTFLNGAAQIDIDFTCSAPNVPVTITS
jgi:hypothetical protein